MPHVPRRYASTIGPPPELVAPPRPRAAAAQPPPQSSPESPPGRLAMAGPRLSMMSHDRKPADIAKVLFGKEPDRDPITGELVLGRPAPAAAPRPDPAGARDQRQ